MRFWYDTEFIDNGHYIDLISIGMVAENGAEYYAVSNNFSLSNCNNWVVENVLPHLAHEGVIPWKQAAVIALELKEFVTKHHGNDGRAEFWGYYSAYDHVAIAQLFGPMVNLPENFPMFTMDVKQLCMSLGDPRLPKQEGTEHNALEDARWNKVAWEFLRDIEAGK